MTRSLKKLLTFAIVLTLAMSTVWSLPATAQEPGAQSAWRVVQIVILGNEHVDEATIRGAITETRVGSPLDFDAVSRDVQNIYGLGYFQNVIPSMQQVPGTGNGVRIIFEVVEFPVVQQVVINSDAVPAEVVKEWLGVKEGEVLNQFALEKGLLSVQERALAEYEVFVSATTLDMDEETGVLTINLPAARVGEIVIEGNQKTRDYVIERELTFKPGDILRRDQVRRSIERVNMLGFFNYVTANFYETEDPNAVGVRIEVEERRTGMASIGAGYSSQDGFIGYAELRDNNFLGRGQRVNLRWEFGAKRNTYDIGFYEPYLFGRNLSFEINLYNRTTQRVHEGEKYTDYRVGGDVTFGRPLGEFTRGFIRYKLENWTQTPEGGSSESGATRSITLSTRTDTTNHPFAPTRGYRLGLSAEFAGGFLGGDVNFTKYEADLSRYFQVGSGGQIVALRAMYGQGHNLPQHEQFLVGGGETVRGYDFGAFTGERMVVFNAEYRFPITEAVQGVVFADLGRAFDGGQTVGLNDMKFGYGVGVRLDTFLGVIRIDYGIGENGGRTYFSIGPTF
ncbi:MAG TPA: BamA/TamA family outer membrane protein [Limnochordales bacterium]